MDGSIPTMFSSPERVLWIALISILFFVLIVAIVRLMGKRLTAQMNNFDWIITVAVGSLAASGILSTNIAISDAALGILVLAGCQWFATWAIVRSDRMADLFKPEPRLLMRDGAFLPDALLHERVSEREVLSAIRRTGITDQDDVAWVILETNGKLSVARKTDGAPDASVLRHVAGA